MKQILLWVTIGWRHREYSAQSGEIRLLIVETDAEPCAVVFQA